MKQAILLSFLLLAACAGSPRPAKVLPPSHDIVVYRGTDRILTYMVPNDGKTCGLRSGEYFKTKTRKLSVHAPLLQGWESILVKESGYYKLDKASDSTWLLHRYTITKVPDAKAKEEIKGMTEVCK